VKISKTADTQRLCMCLPSPLSHGQLYVEFYRGSAFDKVPVGIIE